LNDVVVVQEFKHVFLDEILGLPPRRDIDFTIGLVPSKTSVPMEPYRMCFLELIDLMMEHYELLDKGYIR